MKSTANNPRFVQALIDCLIKAPEAEKAALWEAYLAKYVDGARMYPPAEKHDEAFRDLEEALSATVSDGAREETNA